MTEIDKFTRHLANREMSANTIRSYRYAVRSFYSRHSDVTMIAW